jgi:hypothetical protein
MILSGSNGNSNGSWDNKLKYVYAREDKENIYIHENYEVNSESVILIEMEGVA